VDFGDFLDRDGEAGTPFGEEGDGGGAEDGENVRDAVNSVVLKNLRGVADVADREVLSDRVRHQGNRNSNSNSLKFKFDSVWRYFVPGCEVLRNLREVGN